MFKKKSYKSLWQTYCLQGLQERCLVNHFSLSHLKLFQSLIFLQVVGKFCLFPKVFDDSVL